MDSQSHCIRARLKKIKENVEVFPLALTKCQETLVALEAKVLRAEEEFSMYRK